MPLEPLLRELELLERPLLREPVELREPLLPRLLLRLLPERELERLLPERELFFIFLVLVARDSVGRRTLSDLGNRSRSEGFQGGGFVGRINAFPKLQRKRLVPAAKFRRRRGRAGKTGDDPMPPSGNFHAARNQHEVKEMLIARKRELRLGLAPRRSIGWSRTAMASAGLFRKRRGRFDAWRVTMRVPQTRSRVENFMMEGDSSAAVYARPSDEFLHGDAGASPHWSQKGGRGYARMTGRVRYGP